MTRTNAKERMASILADLKAIQKERDSMIIDCGGYGKYPKTMVAIDGRISRLMDAYGHWKLIDERESARIPVRVSE